MYCFKSGNYIHLRVDIIQRIMTVQRTAIYARVSSVGERQSTERQVADLTRYAAASGMEVVAVFEEKASGMQKVREQLAECVAFLKGGGADTLLVSELSRLGRSLRQVLETIDELTAAGINIYFQDQGMNTLRKDGSRNPVTKMLISILGSFAEMEREQIVYRLTSGRRLAIEKGVKMGRKVGYRLSDKEFLAKYPKVVRKLKEGYSIRETAKVCEVSVSTVQKVKNAVK